MLCIQRHRLSGCGFNGCSEDSESGRLRTHLYVKCTGYKEYLRAIIWKRRSIFWKGTERLQKTEYSCMLWMSWILAAISGGQFSTKGFCEGESSIWETPALMGTQELVFGWKGKCLHNTKRVLCTVSTTDRICQGETFPAWNLSRCNWTSCRFVPDLFAELMKSDRVVLRQFVKSGLLGSSSGKDQHWDSEMSGYSARPWQRWALNRYPRSSDI